MASQTSSPISHTRLKQIATDACQSAIGSADFYDHTKVNGWNSLIINNILKNVITESTPAGAAPSHKYVVNSTIVQHLVPTSALNKPKGGSEAKADEPHITTSSDATATDGKPHVGRRGMHSATQAFWDQKNDGLWSFKYDGGEAKGMDIVVTVIWIAV
ncbi:Tctex-1 [Microdochium trichocladiopsis]|uniref:Tctex-1 n=1 Tax=Microdochium trichocladiopsis TaxID=1682393 RepID=A0A9P8Y3Z8_9PEZI|nr:Tctex-1 [Microdochium trichocladiopsis]KAH7030742.1 Tctex-1 [Microdochium trichocladiopsis]